MLFLVSLWASRKKRESGRARGDVAHQEPWRAGAQGVFAWLRKGRGMRKGFLCSQGGSCLCCVLDKLSCRKKNEVDVNLFLPLKTLFMVAEHCPATAVLHPRGSSVVVVGDVIPVCISSGCTRQTVSNAISK